MKFDPAKISKIIEDNFSHLMPDFYEMQAEYLASLNSIYKDLDVCFIAMLLTHEIYKDFLEKNRKNQELDFSVKSFYQKEPTRLLKNRFKIIKISKILNLPRETVRRKVKKLSKNSLFIINQKEKSISLNTEMIDERILRMQINNVSKFLSKFSIFFSHKKLFAREVDKETIRKEIENKFLVYLDLFLNFQINYFSNWRKSIDMETLYVFLLCTLNATASLKKESINKHKYLDVDYIFFNLHKLYKSYGLSATTISEISRIPRATVTRKLKLLKKLGVLRKDSFQRYSTANVKDSKFSKTVVYTNVKSTVNNLGIFFGKCLEVYTVKL
jgi:predicted transcriptional regulator